MSKVIVGEIEGPSTTSNKITIASGSQLDIAGSPGGSGAINLAVAAGDITTGTITPARLPAGTIVQTVQNSYTTEFTQSFDADVYSYINNGTEDLYVTITPSSASSKILVTFCFGRLTAVVGSGANWGFGIIAVRDGTSIQLNTGTNSPKTTFSGGVTVPDYSRGLTFSFVDSPSSSTAVTYKLKGVGHNDTARTAGFNRGDQIGTDSWLGYKDVTVTNFIAQEIVG